MTPRTNDASDRAHERPGAAGPGQPAKLGRVGFAMGALMVVCCAGPALLAAGTLAAIGGAVRDPWAIGAAAMLVLVAVSLTARRWPRNDGNRSAGGCCPSRPQSTDGADRSESADHR